MTPERLQEISDAYWASRYPYSTTCPGCGAKPSHKCIVNGRDSQKMHPERRREFPAEMVFEMLQALKEGQNGA